jgi:hypothetical protein
MDAMTMSFDVPDPAVLERLARGGGSSSTWCPGSFRIVSARGGLARRGDAQPRGVSLARERDLLQASHSSTRTGRRSRWHAAGRPRLDSCTAAAWARARS